MKLFIRYLKQKLPTIVLVAIFFVIFSVSFLLYRLPIEAVLYPSALCFGFGLSYMLYDFSKIKRLHKSLEDIAKLTAGMINSLPDAKTIAEDDYQAIITALKAEVYKLETAAGEKYAEMSDYYTIWAHKIKTPIASMNLMLQSVDSQLSRRLSGELFKIEQYVEMVLAFVRLDSNYSDYVFKSCDIDGVIRQSVKKFAHDFIYRRISLDFKETGLKAVTDEKWLGFVIDQLISNSLKYTKDGTISIYLKAPDVLCIQDTGIGIAPEDLPRVFDKGYTGYNGRKDKKASGLGLYLCKKICARLGLKIYLESKPGEGTRVMIDFEQYKLNAE